MLCRDEDSYIRLWYSYIRKISLAMCYGDINGQVGRHIDGFDGVHGGFGVGRRNLERRVLLALSGEGNMCIKYMV